MASAVMVAESSQEHWIPQTKLAPDVPVGETIARLQLVNALHRDITNHRLTLLSAPPGYGKSTLLSLWRNTQSKRADDQRLGIAWLSLDASENDRTHFLLALIASLQTLHPNCGRRAKAFLTQNGYPSPVDAATLSNIIGGLLIIDIMQYVPQPFAMVFDSYERITEPAVHEALDYLVRRLPPHTHVVISTTQNPPGWLARLRAYGLLAEFGAGELAYTQQETAAFARHALGADLSAAHEASFYHFIEGWPAGIRMAVKELRLLTAPEERVKLLEGSYPEFDSLVHHPAIDTYFEQAIFRQLKPPLRRFLLQSSVLYLLDAERCEAVTGMRDAGSHLDEVMRRNLFIVRTGYDDIPPSVPQSSDYAASPMRYHRAFCSFLRGRLATEAPDQVRMLHRRAAQVETEPAYRIEHLLSAGSWDEAVEAIQNMLETTGLPETDLKMGSRWSDRLPEEVRRGAPDLIAAIDAQSMPEAAYAAGLTERQYQVLKRLAQGASNQDIADELVVTLPTVKGHVSQIMRKLGVASRGNAVKRAAELGLLQ